VTTRRFDYLRDPAAIYAESFAAIRRETDLSRIPDDLQPLALRMVHSCGDPAILKNLSWSPGAGRSGQEALQRGATILCDSRMVAAGIIRKKLPAANEVLCTLGDDDVPDIAKRLNTTRSAAAVEHWRDTLGGAVVAIGNAPTALFHLLEGLFEGWPKPSLILGFPVGFVGAAESKEALDRYTGDIPYVTLLGRAGGSAVAAAAVNALADGNE